MLFQFSTQAEAGAGEVRIWGLGFDSPPARSCPVPPGWRVWLTLTQCACVPSYPAESRLSLPGDRVLGKGSRLL